VEIKKGRVFCIGRGDLFYNSIEKLCSSYNVVGIITSRHSEEFNVDEEDFRRLSEKLGCYFQFTNRINSEVVDEVIANCADIAVSVNWVSIINSDFINLFKYGILNAHFGDIPKYRGNAVTNWTIINDEKEAYLTIHKMESGEVDTGEIICQKKMKINSNTKIIDMVNFANKNTPNLFYSALRTLFRTDHNQFINSKNKPPGFRCYPRLPEYSKINWNNSAVTIDRMVRASSQPYSGAFSYIKINNEITKLYIWDSRVVCEETMDVGIPGHIIHNDKSTGETHVYTGDGIVALLKVQINGHDICKPTSIFKSIRIHFGIDVEEELIALKSKLSAP